MRSRAWGVPPGVPGLAAASLSAVSLQETPPLGQVAWGAGGMGEGSGSWPADRNALSQWPAVLSSVFQLKGILGSF